MSILISIKKQYNSTKFALYGIIFSMITYIDDLFLTDKTKKHIERIKKSVNKESLISRACLICLSLSSNDVFDIIPVFDLRLSKYKDKDIYVLGVAENKNAAIDLCAVMAASYIQINGFEINDSDSVINNNMRSYFERFIKV